MNIMDEKLSVIGCGYLGVTHAACMSSLGYTVVGVDTDPVKIAELQSGKLPFYEPGLDTLLAQEMKSGRLSFTTDVSAVVDADVHFICVGTPQSKDGLAADLTYVRSAVAAISPYLKKGSLVVGKSTVPVGTAQSLREELAKSAPQSDLAWNPEFLREGFAVEDTLTPNRLVVGVAVLAKAIGYDPRIGNKFLQAGIGFGGGCLPKDIRAFMARAEELGAKQALEFLREIDAINLRARLRVIDVVRSELSEDLSEYKIAVLGATFKPDSDDVRDSPALDIAAQLNAAGAQVVVNDPQGIEPARIRFPNLEYAINVNDALKDADLVLHLTEWKEYRRIDPATISSLVKNKIIIDGRNMLDRELWRKAGWKFRALGRTD